METRIFNHADLPEVIGIWNLHHQHFDPFGQVTAAALEAALFAKPWFDRADFFIFEREGQICGFCHLLRCSGTAVIACLCARPESPESELLDALKRLLAAESVGTCRAGLTLEDNLGYVGLSTVAGVAGLNQRDPAVHRWLDQLGFKKSATYQVFERSLKGFRPPIDRETLFLRRISDISVREDVEEADEQRRWAFAHIQRMSFEVSDGRGNKLGAAEFVAPDNTVCGPLPSIATMLTLDASPANGRDRWTIMSSAEAMSRSGVTGVRVCWEDRHEPPEWIGRLGFQRTAVGSVLLREPED